MYNLFRELLLERLGSNHHCPCVVSLKIQILRWLPQIWEGEHFSRQVEKDIGHEKHVLTVHFYSMAGLC